MTTSFVPKDFTVPATLETEGFRLRMLSRDDAEKDYQAVMETQAYFHSLGSAWPRPGFTLEENLADLDQHQREFEQREAFAYTMVTLDESRVLGCVYIEPAGEAFDADARVWFWVRESERDTNLETELATAVEQWLRSEWPFARVVYPGIR